jgi:hypothetical protein
MPNSRIASELSHRWSALAYDERRRLLAHHDRIAFVLYLLIFISNLELDVAGKIDMHCP